MDLVNGSMSGAQLRELLAEEFSRESAGSKRAIVGEFLRDPASASAPTSFCFAFSLSAGEVC
jgi:hypothetical protein